jgi:acetolactate synthase-1/2/3 large subunit
MTKRSGGQILIDCLRAHGVDRIFGVPGESYLAALDALYDARNEIQFVVCRHESGAAFMADAYARLTGKPGICFVTRGPGACNASVAIHTAFQDSTPVILLVGQVARGMREREAFQEVEYKQFFAPMAKWIGEISEAERIPEHVSHAFHLSLSGRPGPVVLVLPEDMLHDEVEAPVVPMHRPSHAAPPPSDLATFRRMLAEAKRPVVIAGGGGWNAQATRDLQAFADRMDLPITTSLRCQDYFDNRHDNYAGDVGIGIQPALAKRIADADLVIALGPRLGEMTSQGYTLFTPPVTRQTLIHVHAGAEELGRVFAASLLINSALPEFLAQAAKLEPIAAPTWKVWRAEMRAEYLAGLKPRPQPGPVDMGVVIQELARQVPEDTIVCNGAGNYTGWVHKYWRFGTYRSQLAPTAGTMGYGFPAAVAAKLTCPDRTVVCVAGDGCFLMTGQELATAALHRLPIIVLIVNNGLYGTILMHQERHYPGRPFAVELANPDFARLAEAYGAHGELVTETAQFAPALARALASRKLALIELRVSPESISTARTLSEIRAGAGR